VLAAHARESSAGIFDRTRDGERERRKAHLRREDPGKRRAEFALTGSMLWK